MEKTITEELGNKEMESNLEVDGANEATVTLDNCIAVQTTERN